MPLRSQRWEETDSPPCAGARATSHGFPGGRAGFPSCARGYKASRLEPFGVLLSSKRLDGVNVVTADRTGNEPCAGHKPAMQKARQDHRARSSWNTETVIEGKAIVERIEQHFPGCAREGQGNAPVVRFHNLRPGNGRSNDMPGHTRLSHPARSR